jgi:predicted transcriptional regulator
LEAETWQIDEIVAGVDDLERGRAVSHERVAGWLRSWGTPAEREAPGH